VKSSSHLTWHGPATIYQAKLTFLHLINPAAATGSDASEIEPSEDRDSITAFILTPHPEVAVK